MAVYKTRHFLPQFPEITLPMTAAKYKPPSFLGEAYISNVEFNISIDDVNTVNYDLDFDNDIHASHDPCIPYVTDYEIIRDDATILSGIHTGVSYRVNDRFLTAKGRSWKHWFERRIVPFEGTDVAEDSDPIFVREETDTLHIARDLILETSLNAVAVDYNGKRYYAGVFVTESPNGTPTTGVSIDYVVPYADEEKVLSKVDTLANRHPGFDWDINDSLQFEAYIPYRGKFANQIVLEEGVNITDSEFDDEGPIASVLYGSGSGEGGPRSIIKRTIWDDPAYTAAPSTDRSLKYRILEESVDYGEVGEETLAGLTEGDLRRSVRQTEVIRTKVITENLDWQKNLSIGDIYPAFIPNEHKMIDGTTWRLTNIQGTVNAQGDEEITLTLDNSHLAYV